MCKDALDDVYVRVETERRAEGPSNPIDATEESYSDLIANSKGLFDKLLDRQGEIDKIRNVLSILKRSQFIFNLPRRMRESIERGEYAKVVLNYKKVKSIVASAVHASIKSSSPCRAADALMIVLFLTLLPLQTSFLKSRRL